MKNHQMMPVQAFFEGGGGERHWLLGGIPRLEFVEFFAARIAGRQVNADFRRGEDGDAGNAFRSVSVGSATCEFCDGWLRRAVR